MLIFQCAVILLASVGLCYAFPPFVLVLIYYLPGLIWEFITTTSNFITWIYSPVVTAVESASWAVVNEAVRVAGQQYLEMVYGDFPVISCYGHGVYRFIRVMALGCSPCYAVSGGSLVNDAEEPAGDADEVSDEERISWIARMGRSPSWVHERVFAKMLGFDSSTDEGMNELKAFINTVEKGGTGRRGRSSWVPLPEPCKGTAIDLRSESVDNPLHLHRRGSGRRIDKSTRASTTEPTVDVVKQHENYYVFHWHSQITLALDEQCKLIRYATGLYMDENEWRPYVMERRQELWRACLTGSGGRDYYLLDVPQIAVKFWYLFGLEEDTEPAEMKDATRDRIIAELYGILWRSHVVEPPSDMPTVFNNKNTFSDVSGVGDSSEDGEEDLGYDADDSMDVGSLDVGSIDDSLQDQPLGYEDDGEAMEEAMDDTGRQGEVCIV